MSALGIIHIAIEFITPVLAFFAGIYFQRWMRERVQARRFGR